MSIAGDFNRFFKMEMMGYIPATNFLRSMQYSVFIAADDKHVCSLPEDEIPKSYMFSDRKTSWTFNFSSQNLDNLCEFLLALSRCYVCMRSFTAPTNPISWKT